MKTTKKKNALAIVRLAESKLASSKLVRAHLWERVPGKERLYLEPTSQEAVREAAGWPGAGLPERGLAVAGGGLIKV